MSAPERENQPRRVAQLEAMINREPKLAGSLHIVKDMLEEAGRNFHLPQDELGFATISGHQSIVGVGLSWYRQYGEKASPTSQGTIHAEAGVMIKTEPVNLAEEGLPNDAVVKMEVFSRAVDSTRRVDAYRTYGEHRLGTQYYSPEAFEIDSVLQQRLRNQVTQELPFAIADRDRAPEIIEEKLQEIRQQSSAQTPP
jgi:hypothetical protein